MGNNNIKFFNSKRNKSVSNSTIPLEDLNIVLLNAFNRDDFDRISKLLSNLHQILPSIRTFNDSNQCETFLKTEVHDNQFIFLIVSDTLREEFIPRIYDLISIDSIYILSHESIEDLKAKEKIFSDVSSLCHQLKQDIRRCQNDLIPIHLFNKTISPNQLNQLEPNFMYSRLLKETLINIQYDENAKRDFIAYCRSQLIFLHNDEIMILNEFERDYEKHSPIWWYTRECFVYEMLNKALRTNDIDILIKMAFFIRDLHREIERLYISQDHHSMIVYRGQGMSSGQFEKLCNCQRGLISFPNFLSTSLNKQISLDFARRALEKPGLRGIIFRMKIDRKYLNLSNPYASIRKNSYFKSHEKEILFSTHTVFRLENIHAMKDEHNIWQIDLKLTTNQDDVQLEQLTNYVRDDIQSTSNPWENLAKLLLTMDEYDKAQQIYENILEKTSENDYEQIAFLYHQIGCIYSEKKDFEQALNYFEESLFIKGNYSPAKYDDPQLADTYSNIGSIYHEQGKLDDALQYFQLALETHTNDQSILASIYNNIGMVLKRQGQFRDAIEHFEKSLEIDLHRLPPTHPDLAITYSNIGRVYLTLKDYFHAVKYFQKTVDIRRLSLPQNHPSLLIAITNYENTLALMSINGLQAISSAPMQSQIRATKVKLSKHSCRLRSRISSYIQIIKEKH